MNKYWPELKVFNARPRRGTPSKRLLTYLEKFYNGELTTGTAKVVAGYEAQRDILVAAMKSLYATQGHRQTVDGLQVSIPNFWELLFTMHYITHEIELTNNIGYHRRELGAGIYENKEWPYAELKITGEVLKKSVTATTKPEQPDTYSAGVSMDSNGNINILVNGQAYAIAKLDVGYPPFNFLEYLSKPDNSDIDVTLEEIKKNVKGCASVSNLGELARNAGFDRQLKKAFFPTSKKDTIHFRPTASLNEIQLAAVKRLAAKIGSKS